MNWLQSQIQNVISWAFSGAMVDESEGAYIKRKEALGGLESYYRGEQRRPLKISLLGKDYNTIVNLCRVIVDRSVGMLMGAGVEFDLPGEGESAQDEIIGKTWDANQKDSLLHDLAQFGTIYGTEFIKLIPGGRVSRYGDLVTRLIVPNPEQMVVEVAADDIENILRYVQRWSSGDTNWREITEKVTDSAGLVAWQVYREKASDETRGKWERDGEPVIWPYEFAPIAHSKNLPAAGQVYGLSDIEDIIGLQDKYNEAQSNTNKILALQAWAQKYLIGDRWPRTRDDKGNEYIDIGMDKALEIANKDAKIGILQPISDLASSRGFSNDLRRDMMDISGTTDTETIKDRAGQLTNFAVKVLYKSELGKNNTKRMLYGDLLGEINYRLLRIAGYSGEEANPGVVVWGDPLPTNELEQSQVLTADKNMGIVSKQTVAQRRGYEWEDEQERIAAEISNANTENPNIGGQLIRNFLAGRGAPAPTRQPAQERVEERTESEIQ
jgi:hypothetical protein